MSYKSLKRETNNGHENWICPSIHYSKPIGEFMPLTEKNYRLRVVDEHLSHLYRRSWYYWKP